MVLTPGKRLVLIDINQLLIIIENRGQRGVYSNISIYCVLTPNVISERSRDKLIVSKHNCF